MKIYIWFDNVFVNKLTKICIWFDNVTNIEYNIAKKSKKI